MLGLRGLFDFCKCSIGDTVPQYPALAARAQASDEILACAAEQLEIYNRVHDARLFGIRADGGVIFSLVSLAVTFYVFVFFWMFGIDAGR